MKHIYLIVLMVAGSTLAYGQTYHSPIGPQQPVRAMATPPPVTEGTKTDGVVPRGIRGGNPLQMLNPLAPARYGTAGQSVILEPYTGKWNGIKLFEIYW